jgi:UDP-N-acetylglucosamine--dolichyl-phosphate N-acetylglucosaminephosphotransferase
MMDYILLIPILVSFFVTLFFIPKWVKKAKQIDLVWEDMNKLPSKKVAGSGGIGVILGFIIGVLIFIAYRVFYLKTSIFLIEILATLTVIVMLAGIGLIDDLLGWRKGGLSMKSRLILVVISAIPLMVINAGRSEIGIPFLGAIELGIIYPLILIPLGIVGATTTFNFLAGYNGLEAGQGVIILAALSLVAFFTGNSWLSIIALCMIVALLAFLFFNFYPAKVFPGDSLTYVVGGLIAIMAILGNFEKIAVFFFIPYIIETVLKARGKLKKYSFGLPKKDGSLDLRYNKIYGLEHLSIYLLKRCKIKPTEKRVVYSIWIFQLAIVILGFVIFGQGIF